jgi:LmbE family N-acetylglucosaminyl deacetylase
MRAAELAGTAKVFQSTINRDHLIRLMRSLPRPEGVEEPPNIEDDPNFGMPESVITAVVDVAEFLPQKRAAMRAHASQIPDTHFMLAMPEEAFAAAFGQEWYIRAGQGPGITETDLL